MEGLGLRRRKPRQVSGIASASTADLGLTQPEMVAPVENSAADEDSAASKSNVDAEAEARRGAPAPITSPPVISLDDDDDPAAAPPSGSSESASAVTGKASKPLFATSTKHDEKMNEFAREFHQSVLRQTQMGELKDGSRGLKPL